MQFEVIERDQHECAYTRNVVHLRKDNWDDWFKYRTMFQATYIDGDGHLHELGSLKVGQFNMATYSPDIPSTFDVLDEQFFSLGQSEDYYESIKNLENGEFRQEILVALRDVALDTGLYDRAKDEDVMRESLLRDVSRSLLTHQFRRIAQGGAKLTPYDISYCFPNQGSTDNQLEFHVRPNSNPPTNIHVLIGRNGVGKTHLLRSMIYCLVYDNNDPAYGRFVYESDNSFTNFICIAFSPFDAYPTLDDFEGTAINADRYTYIGLGRSKVNRLERLKKQFIASLNACNRYSEKRILWTKIISLLDSDPIFEQHGLSALLENFFGTQEELNNRAGEFFGKLSSGHKVILLSLTYLISMVSECSLILIDEPENHLHPPLLAAFIRALSTLLIQKNGLAIISTHSPVVLQEVPKSCVWKLSRQHQTMRADRLDSETFGENVGILTSEVFGLEVTHAGFHKMLADCVESGMTYDDIMDRFDSQIGTEARGIIRVLIAQHESGEDG